MVSDSDKRAVQALVDLIDNADRHGPDEALADGISRRLAYAYDRPDLRDTIRRQVQKTVTGRLVTGGWRAPKVVFAVMDQGLVVLGGIEWSGHMKPQLLDTDLSAKWSDVVRIVFRFPSWLGGLGIQQTERVAWETGPFEIVIATKHSRIMQVIPDDNAVIFAGAARATAALMDAADGERQSEALLRGLLRYLPKQWDRDRDVIAAVEFGTDEDRRPGFVVVADDEVWVMTNDDCLVEDIAEGDTLNWPLEEMNYCRVQIPLGLTLPEFQHVQVQHGPESLANLTVDLDYAEFRVPVVELRASSSRMQGIIKVLQRIDQSLVPPDDWLLPYLSGGQT